MKKLSCIVVIVVVACIALEACATRSVDWHQEHLTTIKRFKGKSSIPLDIVYGVYMAESAGAKNLGISGRAITHANSTKDGVGFLLISDELNYWRDWQDLPASKNGAIGAMQFLPTTFLWLIGMKVIVPNVPLAKEGETGVIALQSYLRRLKHNIQVDGMLGDETREAILRYLWNKHRFNPIDPDWSEWRKKREYPTWRLARAARILILHKEYRKYMYLERVGANMAGQILRKVDRRANTHKCMDPFVPIHAVSASIAYLEWLQRDAPNGQDALHFAIRAYNQGQKTAKKGSTYGQEYLSRVLNVR